MSTTPRTVGHRQDEALHGHCHAPAFTPVIDPETQIAVIVDENGRTVELGSHGTSTSGVTPTHTAPGDGAAPGGSTDSDVTESYDQDQSTD